MLFESKSVISSFCACVRKMPRYVKFVIGKLKHVEMSFSSVLDVVLPHLSIDPR